MKQLLCLLGFCTLVHSLPATQFYSRIDGSWTSTSTWSTDPSGSPIATAYPGQNDDVGISHEVTYSLSAHYEHFGDILVNAAGSLNIQRASGGAKKFTFAGNRIDVQGYLVTDSDFLLGRAESTDASTLVFTENANISLGDDLILNAHTNAIINTRVCSDASTLDDIYFVGPDTRLCGTGTFIVPDDLRAWDDEGSELSGSAKLTAIAAQMCTGFNIYESEADCQSDIPIVSGTGKFVLGYWQEDQEEVTEISIPSEIAIARSWEEEQQLGIVGLPPLEMIGIRLFTLSGQRIAEQELVSNEYGEARLSISDIEESSRMVYLIQLLVPDRKMISRKLIW